MGDIVDLVAERNGVRCRRRDPAELGARLREGDRSAAPAALNLIENRSPDGATRRARCSPRSPPPRSAARRRAHLIGVTGPPGRGQVVAAVARSWRVARRGRTVAVLAVDPSSKRSGGSLLGDRARIEHDPRDDGVLIRSTAAGERLGGLAAATREAAEALAPAFDVVVIETVGVGQSETDVEDVCDTVAVVVQPGSGDVLQFLKAGIMEVPDVLVVTKADLGDVGRRAPRRDLGAGAAGARLAAVPVLAVSSVPPPSGIEELADALDEHRERSTSRRGACARAGCAALREFTAEHGERGAARARRPPGGRAALGRAGRGSERDGPAGGAGGGPVRRILLDVAILAAVFGIAVGVAELAGAANLGVSFGIGQVCFALALIVMLTRE